MKWLRLLLLFSSSIYSQAFVQTFTDRCTGEIKTIVIPFEGSTVVAFYNRSQSFTINDVRSGKLQAWLEETYAWWATISPCSTNQATTTATQTTTSNATQNATATATSSTSPPPQGGTSQNQTSNTESSSSTTESTATETGGSDSGNDSSGETSSSEEGSSESGDETSSEETSQEESSESEESSERDSEDDGEDSDDGEESEEDDNKKSKQKVNPIIVAANVATMSSLDGSVNFVTNIGLSQASLSGITSYSLNAMIWDNLQQFNINIGKSYTNKKPTVTLYHYKPDGKMYGKTTGGEINSISTTSINAMYSFGMFNIALGSSKVYLLPKNKIVGWATNFMVMKSGKDYSFIPTAIGFATKPYSFNRHTISPMIAVAINPVMFNTVDNSFLFNKNAMFVLGASDSFNLTRNFYANLGFNIVESTANLPMTWAITIGSRFQF